MTTYVLLLRGINVGGRNKIRMAELASMLASLGSSRVRTYIQSGNAVLDHDTETANRLAGAVSAAVADRLGFAPDVRVIPAPEFVRMTTANPFPEAVTAPKTLHLGYLATPPENPNLERMNEIVASSERFHLSDGVFYLHAPDGIGRSKLAQSAEKLIGVSMTMRNWRTVEKLLDLISENDGS